MHGRCESSRQHVKIYCGSYAINDDPERKLCDVCYAYRKGQEDMRERAAKAKCQGCRMGWRMTGGGHLLPGGGYSQCKAEEIRALPIEYPTGGE